MLTASGSARFEAHGKSEATMFHADAFQEFRQAIALLGDGEPQPGMS